MADKQKILVLIQLKDDGSMAGRTDSMAAAVSSISDICENPKDRELLFKADKGHIFAFLLHTSKGMHVIKAKIVTSGFWLNGDSILVLPIADGSEGIGFSRAWTWLQHR